MDTIQLPLPQPEDPPFGPVIYSYTRAQALADGVLVDVTETGKEVGFKLPVAITEALQNRLTPTKAEAAIGQDYDRPAVERALGGSLHHQAGRPRHRYCDLHGRAAGSRREKRPATKRRAPLAGCLWPGSRRRTGHYDRFPARFLAGAKVAQLGWISRWRSCNRPDHGCTITEAQVANFWSNSDPAEVAELHQFSRQAEEVMNFASIRIAVYT